LQYSDLSFFLILNRERKSSSGILGEDFKEKKQSETFWLAVQLWKMARTDY
jgi:hypothetical protein